MSTSNKLRVLRQSIRQMVNVLTAKSYFRTRWQCQINSFKAKEPTWQKCKRWTELIWRSRMNWTWKSFAPWGMMNLVNKKCTKLEDDARGFETFHWGITNGKNRTIWNGLMSSFSLPDSSCGTNKWQNSHWGKNLWRLGTVCILWSFLIQWRLFCKCGKFEIDKLPVYPPRHVKLHFFEFKLQAMKQNSEHKALSSSSSWP